MDQRANLQVSEATQFDWSQAQCFYRRRQISALYAADAAVGRLVMDVGDLFTLEPDVLLVALGLMMMCLSITETVAWWQ
ncbi:MAG: hypothetical protein GPOALKHO_000336 [Sodalis sp.]|uniref:hypothetical protein n=1 Tax=Sodalis sp. (in: enterobacteria) TaxID=1898979 RepID=UPI0038733930|nr:MAG: hypothetical protein GPOALKHO_000259 [Sodalis sp.]WMQ73318.1 MAG: hypothetical protein GPOALKHO_000336 [Sodalis sp.]